MIKCRLLFLESSVTEVFLVHALISALAQYTLYIYLNDLSSRGFVILNFHIVNVLIFRLKFQAAKVQLSV